MILRALQYKTLLISLLCTWNNFMYEVAHFVSEGGISHHEGDVAQTLTKKRVYNKCNPEGISIGSSQCNGRSWHCDISCFFLPKLIGIFFIWIVPNWSKIHLLNCVELSLHRESYTCPDLKVISTPVGNYWKSREVFQEYQYCIRHNKYVLSQRL